jgi:N-acetylmuramoyl-L-alanine amidase
MGMRAGQSDRVKRRALRQAVTENLDTIRGLPPRGVRPNVRLGRLWLRRISMVVVPLTLAGSTFLLSKPVVEPMFVVQRSVPRKTGGPVTQQLISYEKVDPAALPLSVHRVVIDAGHGGTDPGAALPELSEKAITLDIAMRLRRLLTQSGFEVIATRSDDHLIPLRERAHIANVSASDIFVSIHVNSIVDHTNEHGVETYYLGPTRDAKLTELAAEENRESGYSLADMRKLLDGIYLDARRDESQRLARIVQAQLYGGLRNADPGLQNWGVKRAPFLVLVATEMPAILAEVGCISNDKEVAMLHKPEYRDRIAHALFDGIRAYAFEKR